MQTFQALSSRQSRLHAAMQHESEQRQTPLLQVQKEVRFPLFQYVLVLFTAFPNAHGEPCLALHERCSDAKFPGIPAPAEPRAAMAVPLGSCLCISHHASFG